MCFHIETKATIIVCEYRKFQINWMQHRKRDEDVWKIGIDCFIRLTIAIFICERCAQLNDEIEYSLFSIDFCDSYRFTFVQARMNVDKLQIWNCSNDFWYCFQWNCINNKLQNLCFTAFTEVWICYYTRSFVGIFKNVVYMCIHNGPWAKHCLESKSSQVNLQCAQYSVQNEWQIIINHHHHPISVVVMSHHSHRLSFHCYILQSNRIISTYTHRNEWKV